MRAQFHLSSSGQIGVAHLLADIGVPVLDIEELYVALQFEGFPQCALYNGVGGPDNHSGIAASPFSTKPEPDAPGVSTSMVKLLV